LLHSDGNHYGFGVEFGLAEAFHFLFERTDDGELEARMSIVWPIAAAWLS